MDLAEVESKTMSRKAYMKKWRGLTDDEVQEELEQIALERQLIEDSSFAGTAAGADKPPYGGEIGNEDAPIDEGIEEEEDAFDDSGSN